MKVIEFFGLPGSGKTFMVNKITNYIGVSKITNYRILTIFHLYKCNKISFFEYLYWVRTEKKREKSHRTNFSNLNYSGKFYLKKIITNFLPSREKFLKKIDRVFNLYHSKYFNLFKFLNNLNFKDKNFKIENILYWLKFEIIGYEIRGVYNKKNLLNSEGFYQICFSILIRTDLSNKQIEELVNFFPNIDNLIILINRDLTKNEVESYLKFKAKNFEYDIKFIKKYFYLIKLLRDKKNAKILIFKKNNFEKAFQYTIEYLNL